MKHTFLLSTLVFSLLLAGCKPGSDTGGSTNTPDQPTTGIPSQADAKGSVDAFLITHTGAWTATTDAAWCFPSASLGYGNDTLRVSAMPNLTGRTRTATVTITPLSAPRAIRRTSPATAPATTSYVYTQEAADIQDAACHITGLRVTPEHIVAYLTVTGANEGLYKSVSGLSTKPKIGGSGSSFLPPAANIPLDRTSLRTAYLCRPIGLGAPPLRPVCRGA